MDVSIFQQQLNKFTNIEFNAENHAYKIAGFDACSVTEILKKYVKPFDGNYWAEKKSIELQMPALEILKSWELKSKLSKVKGTLVHSYLEAIFMKSSFVYPEDFIVKEFGFDAIQDNFNLIIPQVDKFITDITDKMYPVVTEFIIGDVDYLVCGTVDQIFYNKKSDKLEIWDWKTNKEIKTISRYYHLGHLSHIPDTEFDHYSLQLSLYKAIIEKNTGLEFGNSYLTWFNENNQEYKIFKVKDYMNEASLILNLNGKTNG